MSSSFQSSKDVVAVVEQYQLPNNCLWMALVHSCPHFLILSDFVVSFLGTSIAEQEEAKGTLPLGVAIITKGWGFERINGVGRHLRDWRVKMVALFDAGCLCCVVSYKIFVQLK
ncbi:hypothetical protein DPMN_069886 [Dreissena polymorpha]|uniref:Uncharacterized protein n=1 Tax=Dreissena polymorpha TaxID=45954 RepID=A0A9D3Z4G7_DREPO|nr:hypothetical protein DPMN_069886 [Dreissena polymorpha]